MAHHWFQESDIEIVLKSVYTKLLNMKLKKCVCERAY